ncbi:thioredoxin [Hymenobacter sp. UYCo722]|uniref:thioredoxin n=1 Tax=Hymenobacter sp. UYCo722 TaxID=3156335 RepID=UPI003392D757
MTTLSRPVPSPAAEAAVLLVLLPAVGTAPQVRAGTRAMLAALQRELGPSIRVLTVDETSHPSVVRSFDATDLPAFVLMRHGAELWRQQGLPEGEITAAVLLSKLDVLPAEAPARRKG